MTSCTDGENVHETLPVEVTFDGQDCTITGPTKLAAGGNSWVYKNTSEEQFALQVWRLERGYSFQDVQSLQSELGEYVRMPSFPSWMHLEEIVYDMVEAENNFTATLNTKGEHVIVLSSIQPPATWLCGSFKVYEPVNVSRIGEEVVEALIRGLLLLSPFFAAILVTVLAALVFKVSGEKEILKKSLRVFLVAVIILYVISYCWYQVMYWSTL
jgi:hypothetical protein